MRTSIATVSVSGALTEKLGAIARAGFDEVEIFENDLLASPLSPEAIRARAQDLGLTIGLYQPMRDVEALPPRSFDRALRRAEHKFGIARRLGAPMVLVCSSVSPEARDDDALAAGQLAQLADLAAHHGIRIAYEALAWGRHVDTFDHAWRIVEAADHPALGVCLDSFHILARGCAPEPILSIPGEKIFFVQLADAPALAMDVLQWSRHHRNFPGQGDFDLTSFVRLVRRAGYEGPLSLEVFNDVFRQADAGRTAADAMRSLVALQESAGLARPPAPVPPTGVAFAELVTPDSDRVSGLLAALGLVRSRRHVSKAVDLWECGGARVLVNTEAPSPDAGLSLAALGLESPDARAAATRAEALGAAVLPRRRGEGETVLDAVAAPDGVELFFCATGQEETPGWRADFEAAPRHGEPGGGVTGIDHVALTQPWHQYDEAVLFYRTVVGLRPHDVIDVPAPYGLRRSRAVSTRDGGVRIALSIAPAPMAEHETAQHIALATDDILPMARRLGDRDQLLVIPGNYYDDLDARFDLAPDVLGTYRELGILYDRDGDAEFLHCYTRTVGRVFFEIVQRAPGYRRFDESGAAVRLAAQARA